jgi:hypothetical protein
MARPKKEGMDYFPHDSDSVNDEKIEALRSLYGNDGYAFYFIMLERIYRTNNFELNVSDAETREETFQILSRKMMLNVEEFKKILNTAMKWGCFDKELYENEKLITSRGIKKRSEVVTDKRKSMQAYYKTSKKVSDAETIPETIAETTQSKEEKRREEKSKEKNNKTTTEHLDFFNKIWDLYPNNIGKGKMEKSAAKKKELFKIGFEHLERAINRYRESSRVKSGFVKNGSTFFGADYIDYLDENYVKEETKPVTKNFNNQTKGHEVNYDQRDYTKEDFSKYENNDWMNKVSE